MVSKKAAKKEKDRYVTVCPKCGSDNVKFETNPAYAYFGFINQFRQCCNCGHHGQVFPEELKSKVRKVPRKASEVTEKQFVEPMFGRGYSRVFWYIAFPISIAFLIFMIIALG
jgi:hypothetical protein